MEHPCRESCSGWNSGYQRGRREFNAVFELMVELKNVIAVVRSGQNVTDHEKMMDAALAKYMEFIKKMGPR